MITSPASHLVLLAAAGAVGRGAPLPARHSLADVTLTVRRVVPARILRGSGPAFVKGVEVQMDVTSGPPDSLAGLRFSRENFHAIDAAGYRHPCADLRVAPRPPSPYIRHLSAFFGPLAPGRFRVTAGLPFETVTERRALRFAPPHRGIGAAQGDVRLILDWAGPAVWHDPPKPDFQTTSRSGLIDRIEFGAGSSPQGGRPCFAVRWHSDGLAGLFDVIVAAGAVVDTHGSAKHTARSLYVWRRRAAAGDEGPSARADVVGLIAFDPLPAGARPASLVISIDLKTSERSLRFELTGLRAAPQ